MEPEAVRRVRERLAEAADARAGPADVEAALERARSQLESLAVTAAELESVVPGRITDAIRDGLRAEAAPMSRRVNEIRGLMNQTLTRLERLETDLTAERFARVDDLGLLVDLITAGWRSVGERLDRLELALAQGPAEVHRLEDHRSTA